MEKIFRLSLVNTDTVVLFATACFGDSCLKPMLCVIVLWLIKCETCRYRRMSVGNNAYARWCLLLKPTECKHINCPKPVSDVIIFFSAFLRNVHLQTLKLTVRWSLCQPSKSPLIDWLISTRMSDSHLHRSCDLQYFWWHLHCSEWDSFNGFLLHVSYCIPWGYISDRLVFVTRSTGAYQNYY